MRRCVSLDVTGGPESGSSRIARADRPDSTRSGRSASEVALRKDRVRRKRKGSPQELGFRTSKFIGRNSPAGYIVISNSHGRSRVINWI